MMRAGLDIGSTTIKCVVLDDADQIVYSTYQRHFSHIAEKVREVLETAENEFIKGREVAFAVSGSAGMGLAHYCGIPFVQEVFADRVAARKYHPETDCIIELGGEDAKILFLTNGLEVRMNGTCAGGTGAFIDQMSVLLNIDSSQLNACANQAARTYPIASRCGVFAKSDIQPLINQGASSEDIAASIYRAVVSQTITGLAQGREIRGNLLYLGGPLTFSDYLRRCFDEALHLQGMCPQHSLLYVALGAALYADQRFTMNGLLERLEQSMKETEYASLPPLFENREDYWKFHLRHARAAVPRVPMDENCGPVHIGIDAGSTTVKIAVIDEKAQLLFTDYRSNDGRPTELIRDTLKKLYEDHPGLRVSTMTATGYGEQLISNAFSCDYGIVETVAHFLAAEHFMPEVDFIIDIGGQDMKCFRIEDHAVADIFLNEACSSGCGSFLQTFAEAMGFSVEEFSMQGLFAAHPVDLGSRCTVFMNSSVKQAQKDGASLAAISAGLSISVVKNALYKVIRCSSVEQLGRNIVVQGGTFYNEAVLRAFEKEMGIHVVRPDIAGLMGAYGAALYGLARPKEKSRSIGLTALASFTHDTFDTTCSGCGNHCRLTVNRFPGGRFISGNRCEKPLTGQAADDSLNLYRYKLEKLKAIAADEGDGAVRVGIPLCLNMYELLPFWHTLLRELGFKVVVSPVSDNALFRKGQNSIPSDTVCFPAKMAHGHIQALLEAGVDAIFYPCMSYNLDEGLSDRHYNCPVVAYYPELLADNIKGLRETDFFYEYVDLSRRRDFTAIFPRLLLKHFPSLRKKDIVQAISRAYDALEEYREDVRRQAADIMCKARKEGKHIIVLAGRPYHVDPEINHGIDRLMSRCNAAVVSEDSICHLGGRAETGVLNQWTYHARLYAAARYCAAHEDCDLIQLVSFGCGLDAITADETKEILHNSGKLYTQLKIDEITNLSAVNIRIRSLFAALKARKEKR